MGAWGGKHDQAGRIDRKAYFLSTLVLLIICLFTTISRLYIRVFVQREFTIDDGLILVGFCCLVAGLVLFYTIAEEQFLVSDLTYNKVEALFRAPPNWLDQVMDYEKQVITSLLCTWAAIVCVKMSFIFFFRKLVERIRSMMIFWWVVLLFNVGVCGYGFSVYVLACPERESINLTQSLQCGFGPKADLSVQYALSQMVLDVVGDLLILAIPIRLIWQIKVRLAQKLALAFSLCLTILMITTTIIRVSGLKGAPDGALDSGWEVYWQIISAEVGIAMTAVTAFRTMLVNHRSNSRNSDRQRWSGMKGVMKKLGSWPSWLSTTRTGSGYTDEQRGGRPLDDLPKIERGTLTGIRTFIEGQGTGRSAGFERVDTRGSSGELRTLAEEENWPLPPSVREPPKARAIEVRQEVWRSSESRQDLESGLGHRSQNSAELMIPGPEGHRRQNSAELMIPGSVGHARQNSRERFEHSRQPSAERMIPGSVGRARQNSGESRWTHSRQPSAEKMLPR